MSVKIIFKTGTSAPISQDWVSSNGEPLWDSSHKKFYITNGTSSPTLIGPVDGGVTVNQMETYVTSYVGSHDFNDNIHDFAGGDLGDSHSIEGLEDCRMFGKPEKNVTQYLLDLQDTLAAVESNNGCYAFIDLNNLFTTVGDDRKITLFLSGAPEADGHYWQYGWEYKNLPLFWFGEEAGKPSKISQYAGYTMWVNGVKTFSTDEFLVACGASEITISDLVANQTWATNFFGHLKRLFDFCKSGKKAKVEIIPHKTQDGYFAEIHVTYPGDMATVVTPYISAQGSQLIATVNGTNIYCPIVNGYMTINAVDGCTIDTYYNTQTVKAALVSYTPLGYFGDATSESNANITPVGLASAPYNTNKLALKETSAFGSDGAASFNGSDTISWTPSPSARSYQTVLLYEENQTPDSEVDLVVNSMSSACQSDHYLYIFNNSPSTAVTIHAATPNSSWSDYPVRGLPQDTLIRPGYGVEVSLALRRYPTSALNTAVMTASEPLRAQ